MAVDSGAVFESLKRAFAKVERHLAVKTDSPGDYTLVTRSPSPFPQHKGQPMWFGAVKKGKAYVSMHLMPLYMNHALLKTVSPELKKRMQGKACFNFKAQPEPELLSELARLTDAGLKNWREKKWL
jgi:protocatechuate 3,4-dioxygenase beta subunit